MVWVVGVTLGRAPCKGEKQINFEKFSRRIDAQHASRRCEICEESAKASALRFVFNDFLIFGAL